MADKKETISPSAAEHRENLEPGFTYNELEEKLWSEDTIILYNPRFDITVNQHAKNCNIETKTAKAKLDYRVDIEKSLKKHQVKLPNGRNATAYYDPSKYNPNQKE